MTEAGWTRETVHIRKAIERFRRKTVKGEGENACWIFTGFIDKHGYGLCRPGFGKLNVRAHRYAWIMKNGPIPHGMFVLHKCDVRACVNPDHLFLGSNRDNVDDMLKKERQRKGDNHPARIDPSRQVRGERHGQAKMTAGKVVELRRLLANGLSIADGAKRFGIDSKTVRDIQARKIWKHVSDAIAQQAQEGK